jgi:hypothetical protein
MRRIEGCRVAYPEVQAGADGPHGSGYVIAASGAQLSCARRLAAIYVLSG